MGLAGPRIKQRIPADPRNLSWSNDQTKFGFKMLSKMGWSPGKGLGMNEDGEKEHIKLSIKQDNLGIGATKKSIDNWLDNSNAFDELLKGLNDKIQKVEKEEEQKKSEIVGNEKNEDSNDDDDDDDKTKFKSKKTKKIKKGNKNKNKKLMFNLQSSLSDSNNDPASSDSGSLSSIRLAHRAKFLKSKKAAIQNSDRLNEIFGIKPNKNYINDFNNIEDISTTSITLASNNYLTKINEMSTHEYFAQKMKGLNISGIASSDSMAYNKTNDDTDERNIFSIGLNNEQDMDGLKIVSNDNLELTSTSKKRKFDNNSSDNKSKKKSKKKNKSKEYKNDTL